MKNNAFIALGSNLGDRLDNLHKAIEYIGKLSRVEILKSSSVYLTEPCGTINQPDFFNAVIKTETSFSPRELFIELKKIEKTIGRIETIKWGPRKIDLDLLYYGNYIIDEHDLQIPHKEAENRDFVIIPMLEIEPNFILPLNGARMADISLNKIGTHVKEKFDVKLYNYAGDL